MPDVKAHAEHSPALLSPSHLPNSSFCFVLVTFPFANQERDFQGGLLYTKLIPHLSKSTTLNGA